MDHKLKWMVGIIFICTMVFNQNAMADENIKQKDSSGMLKSYSKPVMLVIGASYAQDWDIKELDGHSVVNKGKEGEVTQKVLARFRTEILNVNPKTVLIWGFINDVARADKSKIGEVRENIKTNITKMINIAQEYKLDIILATEVTIRGEKSIKEETMSLIGGFFGKKGYQHYANENVIMVNEWLKPFAEENKIRLLDFQFITSESSGERKRKFAQDDGSHLTEAAYKVISQYARETLKGSQRKY